MSEERKRSKRSIVVAAFIVLAMYPLSYGPACHLLKYVPDEYWGDVNEIGTMFYKPLWLGAEATNTGQLLADYATWCKPATKLYLPFRRNLPGDL